MRIVSQHPHNTAHRREQLWIAAMVHRVSGVLLACFLPLHFWALGLAIERTAALDDFLQWTEQPAVKFAEVGLIFLLAVHLLGGIRVLVIENLAWHPGQKRMANAVISIAGILAMLFVLRLL
jgi:fumarate reductase subunit D